VRRLTRAEVRRIAIAAQGLGSPRPSATVNIGHVRRVVRRIGVLQIDSVNVVERAHNLTLFSRLGGYDPGLVWRALEERHVFEYWGRMASFCPIEDFPLFRHRMARYAAGEGEWISGLNARVPGYVESVYRQVAERGPLTVADLEEPGSSRGPWWGWADGKVALEHLFAAGRVAVAFRRNFTRYYDIVERVIPSRHLETSGPPQSEAQRRLISQAAKAIGVGTARDLFGYYGIGVRAGRPVLENLVADGVLVQIEVAGWSEPAYFHTETTLPRVTAARALINPFDTYMWNRDRIERLHDFFYRIEIYVPEPKRVHGYYVFPFLLGDDLVARVDLKADRKVGALRVHAAFHEPGVDPVHVARELAVELAEMAGWLGLGEISVGRKGDLVGYLRKAI
jgi:uncharacterized protein